MHPHDYGYQERGQILILTAAAMMVLLGIGALVVDLGFSWMLRRDEQNAADPAALAAARYIPPDNPVALSGAVITDMHTAACFYAKENGFFASDDDTCSAARAASPPRFEVNYPPSPRAGDFQGLPGRVEVVIRESHPSFFGRIFGQSAATVTSSAVASNKEGDANANSLVALDPETCKSGGVSGNNTKIIIEPVTPGTPGGYVHVNSDCSNGSSPDTTCSDTGDGALRIDGSGANITSPHVFVHGTCKQSGSFISPLTEGANRIGDPLALIPPPPIEAFPDGQCGMGGTITQPTGTASRGCSGSGPSGDWKGTECEPGILCVDVLPGVYWGGWSVQNNMKIRMASGIYYMAGGGITLQGMTASIETVSGTGTDTRVMIYSTDNPNYSCPGGHYTRCQGPLDFTANSTFNVKGLDDGPCPPITTSGSCPYAGMLMWQDGHGSDPDALVELGGQTNLNISGTIYAPKAEVRLTGGSAGTGVATVQIIAWRFDLGGGAVLRMPYDPGALYHVEERGLVH